MRWGILRLPNRQFTNEESTGRHLLGVLTLRNTYELAQDSCVSLPLLVIIASFAAV